jgi:transposase
MKEERPVQEFLLSDVTWELIEPLLPVREKPVHPLGCHRQRVPDRQVLNGIFFVLRTGCQWKALDATGICSGSTAHARFGPWQEDGFFARLWEQALHDYDELEGLDWSWLALDGALTKAPLGGGKSGPNPTDRAKSGVKRSLLTEAAGIPVGLVVEGANRHDCKLMRATLESVPLSIEQKRQAQAQEQGLCMDAAYDSDEVRAMAQDFGYTTHIRSRGQEGKAKEAGQQARRWVVERTHSWLNR